MAGIEQLEELQSGIESIIEGLKEAKESVEEINELQEKLEELVDRIKDARDNPESIDPDLYAELAVDLMTVIPDNLPLPDNAKKAIKVVATGVAAFIQGAMGFALSVLAKNFRQHLQLGKTPEEAAKLASNTKAEQAWLLAQNKAGRITATKAYQGKTPVEWLHENLPWPLNKLFAPASSSAASTSSATSTAMSLGSMEGMAVVAGMMLIGTAFVIAMFGTFHEGWYWYR